MICKFLGSLNFAFTLFLLFFAGNQSILSDFDTKSYDWSTAKAKNQNCAVILPLPSPGYEHAKQQVITPCAPRAKIQKFATVATIPSLGYESVQKYRKRKIQNFTSAPACPLRAVRLRKNA